MPCTPPPGLATQKGTALESHPTGNTSTETEVWAALASGVTPGDLAGLGLGTALGLREGDPLADGECEPEADPEGDGLTLLDPPAPDPHPAFLLPLTPECHVCLCFQGFRKIVLVFKLGCQISRQKEAPTSMAHWEAHPSQME